MSDKVIRDGMVAVLYSPDFGAGWSTWNDDKKKWLLFDPEIVAAVEDKDLVRAANIAERKGKELYGASDYTCVLGASDLEIAWIPEGEAFEVTEYDGAESVNVISQQTYNIA